MTPDDLSRAVRHLRRADAVLADIVRRVGRCRFRAEKRTSSVGSRMTPWWKR